jgi:hypothetical protein
VLDLVVIGTSSAKVLADLGYTNVRDNAGGKKDWIDAGLPLETDGEIDVDSATETETASP